MTSDRPSSVSTELVPTTEGYQWPRWFSETWRSDPPGYLWTFDVVMQAGQPIALRAELEPEPGSTLTPPRLRLALSQGLAAFEAVCKKRIVPPGAAVWGVATWDDSSSMTTWSAEPDPAEVERVVHRAVRRRMEPAFLQDVVDLYGKGGQEGLDAVRAKYPTGERNVYRWLHEAAKAGLR